MLNNVSILITGGTGSLGKALTRRILERWSPRRLVIFSRDELKQHEMEQEFPRDRFPALRFFLGDVRDRDRLVTALRGVEYVIHAAALKQVPAAEYNPFEFIKTNILGAQNVVEAAAQTGVHRIIALSTDKAANPINLYGATKLCSDKLFLAANAFRGVDCKYSVVRYGNVFGSRGSAVPLFIRQRATGTVTLTDPAMTRFIIALPQAADFVLRALEEMHGNEIFVPRIPSARITDLIAALAPGCAVKTVGIRPGEKLHEMLISRDEARYCFAGEWCYTVVPPSAYIPGDAARGALVAPDFEYVSDRNDRWLTLAELRAMAESM